jgi:fumarate reductase flavoprotein subunit
MSMETDLAVVGGGIAGLTAANRAAQLGARVLVLEAGEDERYACNSRIATGALNVAHTDPHSEPALLRRAIEADTEGHATPALADALAGTVGRLMAWLRQEGARMIEVPIQGRSRWMLAPPRILKAGLDWQGRGPDVLLQTLAGNLKGRGGTLLLGARAQALRIEDGRCIGVSVHQGERTFEVQAANTVLADGGFQGNAQLVQRFISPRPDCLTQRSAGTGRGCADHGRGGGRPAHRCAQLLWPSPRPRLAFQSGPLALPHHGYAGRRRHHGGSFRLPFHRRRPGRDRAVERAGALG